MYSKGIEYNEYEFFFEGGSTVIWAISILRAVKIFIRDFPDTDATAIKCNGLFYVND